VEKGFAATTLSDIAETAGMSPSHLYYYYQSKEAMLEELYGAALNQTVTDLKSRRDLSAEEQCQMLVDYFFSNKVVPVTDQAILLEITALALHNPQLRKLWDQQGEEIKKRLRDIFDKAPRAPGLSADDATALALSVRIGLYTVSCFDEKMTQSRARELYRRTLLQVAGFLPASAQARSNGAPRSIPKTAKRQKSQR